MAEITKSQSIKSEYWTAAFIGILKFVIFSFYGINLWIATIYIDEQRINPNTGKVYTIGNIFTNIFSILNCTSMAFQLIPNIQAIVKAKIIGKQIFDVIDRQSPQKQLVKHQEQLPNFSTITFKNITFKYSSQQNDMLQNINLLIKGQTSTVIVGASGSGKSTIIQLLERFYSPNLGEILIDDVNINNISLRALRESIGYVQQEPILLQGTIRDNILFGNKDATEEEIQNSLRKANASFVFDLENGVDTYVGTSSLVNLSGGQKQRIAIARAL
ncbi:abc transporter [Stylonychia lemnae]|uniref:Abc transporter n=1 Tax=Stylonychia lemnae TaxID=5949 RepID=A0A078AJE1_STYLE|nr:abc transporter [Stylonychia lemnae]|eukprot:CDW81602.1 abc transporter [Stylonychia lemnae]